VSREFVERRPGLLRDRRVEIFALSALHAREQITDIVALALITQESRSHAEITSRRSSGSILAAGPSKPRDRKRRRECVRSRR